MKGILFKPDMIKAIVEGQKTVTRRIIKPQPSCQCEGNHWEGQVIDWIGYKHEGKTAYFCHKCGSGLRAIDTWSSHGILPRYHIGEVVYIKEAWSILDVDPPERDGIPTQVAYKDGQRTWLHRPPTLQKVKCDAWFSPMFLPLWAARYFVQVLDVRPERLQEITEEDALKEGITIMQGTHQSIERDSTTGNLKLVGEPQPYTARYHYEALWDSINGDGDFARNKWVWRYEYKMVERPLREGLKDEV